VVVEEGKCISRRDSKLSDAVTLREQRHLKHGSFGRDEIILQDGGSLGSSQFSRSKTGQKDFLEKSSHLTQTLKTNDKIYIAKILL
jgi:hypothetical protein